MSENPSSTPSRTAFQDSTDESIRSSGPTTVNRADARVEDRSFVLSVIAIILSAIAVGAIWSERSQESDRKRDLNELIEAKIKAGMATAENMANNARIDARVALDKIEDARTKLAEKGIHLNLNGH